MEKFQFTAKSLINHYLKKRLTQTITNPAQTDGIFKIRNILGKGAAISLAPFPILRNSLWSEFATKTLKIGHKLKQI